MNRLCLSQSWSVTVHLSFVDLLAAIEVFSLLERWDDPCFCWLQASFNTLVCLKVRASMDEAGAYELKVIPCTPAALHGTVENAIHLPEPEWEKPKPSREHMGSANWGSVRTILFSGLS